MHESDSFISEVSEEVRRDQLYRWLSRYGWIVGAAIVLLVGGAAYHAWATARATARAEATGDALRAAAATPDAAARATALADFAAANPDAGIIARFAEAASLAEAGERDGAGATLAALAGDGAVPALYRDLAALERVMLLGSALEPSERAATLDGLTQTGAPFRPLALEQRALMHLEAGDNAAAITDLNAILTDPSTTEALDARARQLLLAAGGTIPEIAPPAATEPVDG